MATVEFSNRAKKDLRAISPGADAARIVEALRALAAGAANLDVTALEGRAPWLRLRVGNYRVLYRPIEGGSGASSTAETSCRPSSPSEPAAVHNLVDRRGQADGVPVIDVAALRPDAAQTVLVAGLLADVKVATAAELSADLRLPVVTVAAVLRVLERSGRARRGSDRLGACRHRTSPASTVVAGRGRLGRLSRPSR